MARRSTSNAPMPTTPKPMAGDADRGGVPLMVMRSLLAWTAAGLSKALRCEGLVKVQAASDPEGTLRPAGNPLRAVGRRRGGDADRGLAHASRLRRVAPGARVGRLAAGRRG